jgi:hypothetical protein
MEDGLQDGRGVSGKPSSQLYYGGAEAMRFSWKSLLLAPLPVPLILSAVMAPLMQGGEGLALLPFLILLIPGCIISYGTMIFLFLPALFLLSHLRPVTGLTVCMLGLVLGSAVMVPVTVMAWKASGPDSGPPTDSFWVLFVRWAADPLMLVFPVAGLLTAALYWWLGTRRQPVNDSVPRN